MSTIDTTLAERGTRYGEFPDHARITQGIKVAMGRGRNWQALPLDMKEALEMVAHKIGRILNGDANYVDSWTDIIGYTRLVEKRLLDAEKAGNIPLGTTSDRNVPVANGERKVGMAPEFGAPYGRRAEPDTHSNTVSISNLGAQRKAAEQASLQDFMAKADAEIARQTGVPAEGKAAGTAFGATWMRGDQFTPAEMAKAMASAPKPMSTIKTMPEPVGVSFDELIHLILSNPPRG